MVLFAGAEVAPSNFLDPIFINRYIQKMRITVEIDEKKLEELCFQTGISKKSPAIAKAIEDYLIQRDKEAFLKKVLDGETDYSATNDQIEEVSQWESVPSSS